MRTMLWASCFIAGMAVAGTAVADQCAWITKEQGDKAVQSLEKGKRFLNFCKSCGDAKPGAAHEIKGALNHKVPKQAAYWQVSVNGKPQDLAYLYVEGKAGVFHNVAKIAGCATTDVKATVHLEAEPSAGGACKKSGCSAQICSDKAMVTTCEWRPEYACYRTAECKKQAHGKCGWTMTPALKSCLGDKSKSTPVGGTVQ